jgi:hypothetical protein
VPDGNHRRTAQQGRRSDLSAQERDPYCHRGNQKHQIKGAGGIAK